MNGPIGEPGENTRIWKWMFVDLEEDEHLDVIIRDRSRWCWGGRFRVSDPVESDPEGDPSLALPDPLDLNPSFELLE